MDLEPPRDGLMPGSAGGEELLYAGRPTVIEGIGGLLLALLTVVLSAVVMKRGVRVADVEQV